MPTKIPIVMSWSGGKDAAMALHKLLQNPLHEVRYLFSTFHAGYKRLSMHGVRESLVEAQAQAIGIPLVKMYVHENTNVHYETQMAHLLQQFKAEGICTVAFGDIFLADLRDYREEKSAAEGFQCLFPLWEADTTTLAVQFVAQGFESITCCTNESLGKAFCGRYMNHAFFTSLPANVDPCGENGEYHSFCFNGPIFNQAVGCKKGKLVFTTYSTKDNSGKQVSHGFWYQDLLLNKAAK